MADLMQWGADWFHSIRASHLAQQDITYKRSGIFTLEGLTATFSRTTRELDVDGVAVAFEVWSFIMQRSHLVHNEKPFLPTVGDIISFEKDGMLLRYDVANMGEGTCWRPHDRFRNAIVIYTEALKERAV